MLATLLTLTMILIQPQAPPVTRDIRGVVISAGTPDAVPDAEVSVGIDKSDLDTVIAAFKYDQKFPKRTTSDGSGHFSFKGLVPGKFIVTVQHDGFFAKAPDAKGNIRDSVSVPVTVLADQEGSEISVPMLAGAVVAGRVFGIDGRAVARVSVRAFAPYTEDGVSKFKPVASRETNDEGAYRLFWLPPGEYVVGLTGDEVWPGPGFILDGISPQTYLQTFFPNAPDEATASRIAVKSGDDVANVDINLRAATGEDLRKLTNRPPAPPPPPGR
jgi:hypothetical protein